MSDTIMKIIFAIIVVVIFVVMIKSEMEWKAWADVHCKVVAKTEAQTSFGYAWGKEYTPVSVTQPGTTTYKCDDGVVYTR